MSGAGDSADLCRLAIPASWLEGLQPAEQILLLPRSISRRLPACQFHSPPDGALRVLRSGWATSVTPAYMGSNPPAQQSVYMRVVR